MERQQLLVVDDQKHNRTVLTELFKDQHKVLLAKDGLMALELARKYRPAVILLDVLMPGLDGYQTLAALKADPATAGIPVIFITALDSHTDEEKGLLLGAADYIAKPFMPAIVRARVNNYMQSERQRERLQIAQQQLLMQEKMASLGTLTAGVAHELNNPLNFADVAVQNLERELAHLHDFLRELAGEEAPAEVMAAFAQRFAQLGEMTAIAREGHQRIKAIVLDLRQFTRLDEAQTKTVPIAEPILSTVNLIRTKFDRSEFRLDLSFNPAIDCQPAKLGQVFMSLCVNACEAINKCADARPGAVTIKTAESGPDWLQIEVADNGCGMDNATRGRIFEPFFTTKTVGAGTGLGLAIVFGIIEEHGGSIAVESTPGVGTRFCLRLPLRSPNFRADPVSVVRS